MSLGHKADQSPPPCPYCAPCRRSVISVCRGLTALDHKPVFPQERKYAEAWWRDLMVGASGLSLQLWP